MINKYKAVRSEYAGRSFARAMIIMKLILFIFAIFLSGCSIVGPGEKGLITHFGAIQPGVLDSGAYLWIPFSRSISKFDLRVQKNVVETTAASKDLQDVHTYIAINWRIDPAKVESFYKDVGYEEDAVQKIIIPAVGEVLKYATAKKTAEEIVGRRIELKEDIDNNLRQRTARYGIQIDDVSIVNIQFSSDFTHAIEQKQIAEQQSKQAQYLADKAIKDAQAEVNKARGQAESQKLIKNSITPEILKKMAIEKWDGHFPQVMGQTALPFINLRPDDK